MLRKEKTNNLHSDVQPDSKRRIRRQNRKPKPEWDSKTGTLSYKGVLVLRVMQPHSFQWMLITAFAAAGWKPCIPDPLRGTEWEGVERLA